MSSSHAGRRLLVIAAGALTALAMLAPAAQAATPLPGYTQFTGCPTVEQDPSVETCLTSVITGGHFKMGSKNVPITKPIALTGGRKGNGDIVWNSEGGLDPVKLEIPGGIVGLTGLDWLVNLLSLEQLKVYAVTETVGTPNLDASLKLPIRVHLINPVLGNNCYVGSATEPISLNLITGTTNPPPPNEPITGQEFGFSYDESTNIISLPDAIFVDNSFAAPAAKGCVLNIGLIPVNIDAIVNLQSGLPSPAGTNETVQEADAELTPPTTVYGP
jgi:hypothetical protein